jgi:peptidoglycan/LPS O-acetylase OafA/YrhL
MGFFRFFLAAGIVYIHTATELKDAGSGENHILVDLWAYDATGIINSFFIISGFIILLTLNKNYHSKEQNYITQSSKFYINRILRIFPLYYLSIIIFYADVLLLNIIRPSAYAELFPIILDIKYILSNMLLIFQDSFFGISLVNSVAWSLDIELHWYLFAPFLYYFFYFKYNLIFTRIILYTVIILYPVINISTYIPFIFGFLIYDFYLIYQSKFNEKISLNILLAVSTFLICFPLIVDLNYDNLPGNILYIVSALVCFSVNFKNRIDKFFGDLSYPIFILHQPLFFIIFLQTNKYGSIVGIDRDEFFMTIFLISMVIFSAACYLILLLFQYPLDRLRNKIKLL